MPATRRFTPGDIKRIAPRGALRNDLEASMALARNHIIEGLKVEAPVAPSGISLLLTVSEGTAVVDDNYVEYAGGIVSGTLPDATNARYDNVEIDKSGDVYYVEGTAAATPRKKPVDTYTRIVLATVHRAALDQSIADADIDRGDRPRWGNLNIAYVNVRQHLRVI